MGVEVFWLPELGPWTDAVHSTGATCLIIVGAFCAAGLLVRGYRLLLQALAWLLGK